MSFLTALFRGRSDLGTLSTTQAVTLLENVVGHPTKLDNVTVKPLTSGIWFVTSLLYYLSGTAGGQINQPVPTSTSPSLPATWAYAVSLRGNDQPSGDDSGDKSSSDDDIKSGDKDYLSNSDDNDERLSNNDNKRSSSRKNSPWSPEDENHLRKWKEEGRSWAWICSQFPNRSPGAVHVRWYTKRHKKL